MAKKYFSIFNILLLLVGIAIGYVIRGNISTAPTPSAPQAPTEPTKPSVEVSTDDDPAKGKNNAPVTIVEFSDYQCSFCARFVTQTLPQLEKNYIDTGKVKFVYRDFPLNFHQYAQKAAEAAECADEQEKYWEYHDLLFEKQSEWSNAGLGKFKDYANQLGLDTQVFDQCLDSGEMTEEIQKDFQDGQSYGVSGTPAFFINGELLSGAQPYEKFQEAIESALE